MLYPLSYGRGRDIVRLMIDDFRFSIGAQSQIKNHSIKNGLPYLISWQRSQAWLIVRPSLVEWLPSWQRKQPGKSMWPMLFG